VVATQGNVDLKEIIAICYLQVQALPAACKIPVASLFDFVTGLKTLLLVPEL
jgi:hypothetical protein